MFLCRSTFFDTLTFDSVFNPVKSLPTDFAAGFYSHKIENVWLSCCNCQMQGLSLGKQLEKVKSMAKGMKLICKPDFL